MAKKCPKGKKLKKGSCVSAKSSKLSNQSTGMKIFLGIALALIFFGLFNLGVSVFYDHPQYGDYCHVDNTKIVDNQADCENAGGVWTPSAVGEQGSANGFCDLYATCGAEYDQANSHYATNIFYIFVVSGMILAIVGLFIFILPFQIVLLGGGTALIIEGIIRNLDNKISAFIAGVLVFAILSYFVWRKFK